MDTVQIAVPMLPLQAVSATQSGAQTESTTGREGSEEVTPNYTKETLKLVDAGAIDNVTAEAVPMIKSVQALAAHTLFYWKNFKPEDDLPPRPDEGLVLVEKALEAKAAGISTSGRSEAPPVNSGQKLTQEQIAQVRERARFTAVSGDQRDEWQVSICYGREVRTKRWESQMAVVMALLTVLPREAISHIGWSGVRSFSRGFRRLLRAWVGIPERMPKWEDNELKSFLKDERVAFIRAALEFDYEAGTATVKEACGGIPVGTILDLQTFDIAAAGEVDKMLQEAKAGALSQMAKEQVAKKKANQGASPQVQANPVMANSIAIEMGDGSPAPVPSASRHQLVVAPESESAERVSDAAAIMASKIKLSHGLDGRQ